MSNTTATENAQNSPDEHPKSTRQTLLEDIGHKLSSSREARGEALDQPVRILKLRKRHVQALESGNWDGLPDDVYVLGFLRQYSRYLNVDLSNEIEQLKNNTYALTKPMTFPDPPVAPSRHWAWVFGIAFVLLFIAFNLFTQPDILESSNNIQQTPAAQTAADTSTNSAPNSASQPDTASNAEATPAAADKTTTEAPASQPQTILTTPTGSTLTARAAVSSPASDNSAVLNSTARSATASSPATADKPLHSYRFDAMGSPVWLQVSLPNKQGTAKGKRLKEVLLKPGHHLNIRHRSGTLWITCGNAPALQISADGKVVAAPGSLGSGRKVLRNYRFSIAGKQ